MKEFLHVTLPKIKSDIKNQVDFIKENLDEIEEELQGKPYIEFRDIICTINKLQFNLTFESFEYIINIFNFSVWIFIFYSNVTE